MDDYGKAHNDIAKRDARADELTSQLDLLEAVDRRITSEHPARRFRRLAADIGENDAGRAEGTSGGSTLAAVTLGYRHTRLQPRELATLGTHVAR